jgi:hypothetical protein
MEAETFSHFFTRSFIRNIHPGRPAVLICDGHISHSGVGLTENARKENVVILKLPSHRSHVLQPMDLIKLQHRNYKRKLPKSTFSSIISNIWKKR